MLVCNAFFQHVCICRYDADKSGTIDKEELALVLHHLGEGVDNDTLDALMEEADDDGNGEVSGCSTRLRV